jgi:DNA-binding CsgD family transcriptional regulator
MPSEFKRGSNRGETSEIRRGERPGMNAHEAQALTPGEQRVALLAARGKRNDEIAAALELSPKTVEWTLTRVYRKVGVRSRTELALRLATGETPWAAEAAE